MTSIILPSNTATRFKYARWDIALAMLPDGGIGLGPTLSLLYDDPGTGWLAVASIDGPMQESDWVDTITAAGGYGNYIVSKFPQINVALAKYFDTTPDIPTITNQTPVTQANLIDYMNDMLFEYITLRDDGTTGHPKVVVKAYP